MSVRRVGVLALITWLGSIAPASWAAPPSAEPPGNARSANAPPANAASATAPPPTAPSANAPPANAASAAPAPAPSAEAPATPDDLEQAKRLFLNGVQLLDARDPERALVFFLRSREAVPSVANVKNAAYCLTELGRLDEAVELYEELLTRFGAQLDEAQKDGLAGRMQQLRRKLGSLDVGANVNGVVVVDGRMRGKLPLLLPIRLMPGLRKVRVVKDGYETYETTVPIEATKSVTLDASLRPLGEGGRLTVDGPKGAELFVDGAPVGTLPWTGSLAPGDHLYFARSGDRGTAPRNATVVRGQDTSLTVSLEPLGAPMAFRVEPPDARLVVDEVPLARGGWQGRLPLGAHVVLASEAGYLSERRTFSVAAERSETVILRLAIDRGHPRWHRPSVGTASVAAFGGPAILPTLAARADETCTICGVGTGGLAGLRFGFELPVRVALEVASAYLHLGRHTSRATATSFGPADKATSVTYLVDDSQLFRGPVVSFGASYRAPFARIWSLVVRMHLGGMFARARDRITVHAENGADAASGSLDKNGALTDSFAFLLLPSIDIGAELGPVRASLGFDVVAQLLRGPDNRHGELIVTGEQISCASYPAPVACAPGQGFLAHEQAYGMFAAFVPTAGLAYRFR